MRDIQRLSRGKRALCAAVFVVSAIAGERFGTAVTAPGAPTGAPTIATFTQARAQAASPNATAHVALQRGVSLAARRALSTHAVQAGSANRTQEEG